MGTPKQRAGGLQPMRTIIGEHMENRVRRDGSDYPIGQIEIMVDELDCGHCVDQVSRTSSTPAPTRRRCPVCKSSVDPGREPDVMARRSAKGRERRARR